MKNLFIIALVIFSVFTFGLLAEAADTTQSTGSRTPYELQKKKPDSQPGKRGQQPSTQRSTQGQNDGRTPYTMQEPKKN